MGCKVVEVKEEVEVNPYTLQLALVDIAKCMEEDRFEDIPVEGLSKLSVKEIKKEYLNHGGKIGTHSYVVEEEMEKDHLYGVIEYQDEALYAMVEMNDELKVQDMQFAPLASYVTTEDGDHYYEESKLIGRIPLIQTIVTYPKDVENPKIFVLMGNSLKSDANGIDDQLKDIAHHLANLGYASIRMEGRVYRDPLVIDHLMDYDLDRIYKQDLACMIHSIDTLPVNALSINYFGVGIGANIGFDTVCNHFEVNGVTVLLDPYDSDDQLEVMKSLYNLSDATINEVRQELKDEVDVGQVGGYPIQFFKQIYLTSMNRYYNRMVNPILLVQTNSDEVSIIKRLNGINVVRLNYEDQAMFDEDFYSEFKDWMDGENVLKNRKKKKEEELKKKKAAEQKAKDELEKKKKKKK